MPLPPCAATCPAFADLLAELARAHGKTEPAERAAHGLPSAPDSHPTCTCRGDDH